MAISPPVVSVIISPVLIIRDPPLLGVINIFPIIVVRVIGEEII